MQHSCWPLSSPVPQICSWFSNLQPPRDLRGETRISPHLGCVVQSSGQEDACFCVREKLQCKGALESCGPPLWCLWTPCFWGQTSTCSTNHLCLFPPSICFHHFYLFTLYLAFFSFPTTSCLYFPFLIQYIYACGGGCIGLYAWTDYPRAVLQH